MSDGSSSFLSTRRSLLDRLKDWNDQASWQEFVGIYAPLIQAVARKTGMNETESEDVVQETLLCVAKQMTTFRYDPGKGSFKSWLLQVTRCRIIDQARKRQYRKDGQLLPKEETLRTAVADMESMMADSKFETFWLLEWEKNVLRAAMEKVKAQSDPRQYQLFHLHVVKELPAREAARRVGAKLPEVYFAKYKISGMLKREIRRLEKKGI